MEEIAFIGRDNTIELALAVDNAAINHTAITRVQLQLGGGVVVDSNVKPGYFDMTHDDRLILQLGGSTVVKGIYRATLIIYDANNTNGLVWGGFTLIIN